jgi:hypothetical protein
MKAPRLAPILPGWKWLIGGSLVLGLQSLILTGVIAIYAKVTLVNIVFSSRGLWNFLLIWFLGHWFRNSERLAAGPGVMRRRLIGAALMFSAIVIVSLRR